MEGYDHSDCPVEIRDCPDHVGGQGEGEELPTDDSTAVVAIDFKLNREGWEARPHCECGCAIIARGDVVGFCLYCDHVYSQYKVSIQAHHFAYDCPGAPEKARVAARASLPERRT